MDAKLNRTVTRVCNANAQHALLVWFALLFALRCVALSILVYYTCDVATDMTPLLVVVDFDFDYDAHFFLSFASSAFSRKKRNFALTYTL